MSVEYHESAVTNMEIDDSKTDTNVLRNNHFRVATVCLGLLGVVLLARLIGQSVHSDELRGEVERLKAISQDKKCPAGWKKFQVNCYYIPDDKKNWAQSREFCQSKGADLVIIKSQEEMTFINQLYESDKELWIGLTDEEVEGEWRWVDGTPLTTAFWGKDQPNSYNGTNQDCVEFCHQASGTGYWNDENCNFKQKCLCEM